MSHKREPRERWQGATHKDERTASTPGTGLDAEPPTLERWAGWDLTDAEQQQGERLLRARDGRIAALLSRARHHTPGDVVGLTGVSQRLQLVSLIGVVVGGSLELWTLSAPWTSTVRYTAERPRR